MDEPTLSKIRDSYDLVADEYARRIFDELQHKPFDRLILDRFAKELGLEGEACDMGCGPGHVARYLSEAGVKVFGLDLSLGMLEQARRLNPELSFREGNLYGLDLADGSLGGITAFYAIVNLRQESLPVVFQEMYRVLKPGGRMLLAFHAGLETRHETELWGRPINLDFFLFPARVIRLLVEHAGFAVDDVIEREPYPEVEFQSRRAYISARKPNGAR
jgi:SAM-dependent methyltransferase